MTPEGNSLARNPSKRLFEGLLFERPVPSVQSLPDNFPKSGKGRARETFVPVVDGELIDVFERVSDPTNAHALLALYMSRVEAMTTSGDSARAQLWRSSRKRRDVSAQEILTNPAIAGFIKELFNHFFRDDLYGRLRNNDTIILSSGAVCEESFGLTTVGKAAVSYALDRDWYGYSDCIGLPSAREAIARYENARMGNDDYDMGNVSITMGATHAVNCLADLILGQGQASAAEPLIAIPNYPPLVRSITKYGKAQFVALETKGGEFSVDVMIDALRPSTPLLFLQTVANPTGARVNEESLARLIAKASPNTMIILDECHEFLGLNHSLSSARARSNVVRVSSLSKVWSTPGMKLGWITSSTAIIDSFYEQASTGYGGPPSLFYTLIEVIARFERWRINGVEHVTKSQRAEFGEQYELTPKELDQAYQIYLRDYATRDSRLALHRDTLLDNMPSCGLDVLEPKYSINALVFPQTSADSYCAFRDLMDRTNVSSYPGILNFCFGTNGVRVTSARPMDDLRDALFRLLKAYG